MLYTLYFWHVYSFVAVVVVRDPPETIVQSNYLDAQPYVDDLSVNYYITAAWDESVIQDVPDTFVVGDLSTTTADGVQYTNGPLDSNTRYGVFIRYEIDSDESNDPLSTYSDAVIVQTGLSHLLHCHCLTYLSSYTHVPNTNYTVTVCTQTSVGYGLISMDMYCTNRY